MANGHTSMWGTSTGPMEYLVAEVNERVHTKLRQRARGPKTTKRKNKLRGRKAMEEMGFFYPKRVLAAKKARNRLTALVLWDGYAEEESTWEPVPSQACIIRTLYLEYKERLAKRTADVPLVLVSLYFSASRTDET